ncbi:hypothetical protein J2S74_002700 [Evansella vedderi]|uniref:Uncharacterized protein n=1 Tax=Evansella vedderi TaxID=38282 RepID=A0ABT9ZVP7_9BACI|nr:hypothetical protein [Evansella vedderi]
MARKALEPSDIRTKLLYSKDSMQSKRILLNILKVLYNSKT